MSLGLFGRGKEEGGGCWCSLDGEGGGEEGEDRGATKDTPKAMTKAMTKEGQVRRCEIICVGLLRACIARESSFFDVRG